MKKLLLSLLALIVPLWAMGQTFSGQGAGTETNPYQISTPEQLNEMHYFPGSSTSRTYFKLMADIDMRDYLARKKTGWEPVGDSSNNKYINFDGNNHTISNLWIDASSTTLKYIGFFGIINGTIKDLTLNYDPEKTVTCSPSSKLKDYFVGLLAGHAESATITNVKVTASKVSVTGEGRITLGGFVGYGNSCTFSNNSVSATCVRETTYLIRPNYTGGFLGTGRNNEFTECTSAKALGEKFHVKVVADDEYIGGFVGLDTLSSFRSCSAEGDIIITGRSDCTGGLVGKGDSNIYSCAVYGNIIKATRGSSGGIIGEFSCSEYDEKNRPTTIIIPL